MTKEQAQRIGRLIAAARQHKGWSLRRLSIETGFSHPALHHLEHGEYTHPSPERLLRISDVLGIDPERIEQIANARMSESLPGVRTYFRAKYDLTPEEIDEIERTVQEVQRKHEGR
jgi:transcriptional regulator with XRE-family HTH domain